MATLSIIYFLYHEEKDLDRFYAAGEDGDSSHQTSLGFYYYQGDPFPLDYAKAVYWWQRAANKGDAKAQFDLGYMCWYGKGVAKDEVQAYMWITLAAEQGNVQASRSLPRLERIMTPDQVAEANRRASAWKTLHANIPAETNRNETR